jgi:hypothetical protein
VAAIPRLWRGTQSGAGNAPFAVGAKASVTASVEPAATAVTKRKCFIELAPGWFALGQKNLLQLRALLTVR